PEVFDFGGTDEAAVLYDSLQKSKTNAAATDKQRGRNDQCERDLQGEFGALAARTFDFDVTVESVEIRADHIEAHATAREFGLGRGRRKARMKEHIAHGPVGAG